MGLGLACSRELGKWLPLFGRHQAVSLEKGQRNKGWESQEAQEERGGPSQHSRRKRLWELGMLGVQAENQPLKARV